MKKLFCIYTAAFAALTLSCSKDSSMIPADDSAIRERTLLIVSPKDGAMDAETKVTMNSDYSLEWDVDDAICVFDKDKANNRFSTSSGGPTASFTGTSGDAPYWLLYPYNSAATIDAVASPVTFRTDIPSEQSLTAGTFDKDACLMVGYSSDGSGVTMKHAGALMGFSVAGSDVTQVQIYTKNVYLAGTNVGVKATVSGSNISISYTDTEATTSYSITGTPATGSYLESGAKYYMTALSRVLKSNAEGALTTVVTADASTVVRGSRNAAGKRLSSGRILNLGTLDTDPSFKNPLVLDLQFAPGQKRTSFDSTNISSDGDWLNTSLPTSNSSEQTYAGSEQTFYLTKDGTKYTFYSFGSKYCQLRNDQGFRLGETDSYIKFPVISGKVLRKVVYTSGNTNNYPTSIVASSATGAVLTGGEKVSIPKTTGIYTTTWYLDGLSSSTEYQLRAGYINCLSLTLTYVDE